MAAGQPGTLEDEAGAILLEWLKHESGPEMFCPVIRVNSRWALQNKEALPPSVEVTFFAHPPKGPALVSMPS